MKIIYLNVLILLFAISAKAGFVIGYQGGIWVPGVNNVQAKTFYYDKKYGADFGYNQFFHGLYVGIRNDFKKGWIELSWNNKHNVFTSEYNMNGTAYKESIKVRLNDLVLAYGYKVKSWGLGMGIDIACFNVKSKSGSPTTYDGAKWVDAYGKPIAFIKSFNYPAFDICVERALGDAFILKGSYFFGIGSVRFWNEDRIKPSNFTLALFFNLKKSKSNKY